MRDALLVAWNIAESSLLPFSRWKIPAAGAGFVIVASRAITRGCISPVIETDLEQRPARDLCPNFRRASLDVPGRNGSSRRCGPETPYATRIRAHPQNH